MVLGAVSCWVIYYVIFYVQPAPVILLSLYLFLGVCMSIIPLCNELAIECVHPVGHGTINGILGAAMNVGQTIFGLIYYKLAVEIKDPPP